MQKKMQSFTRTQAQKITIGLAGTLLTGALFVVTTSAHAEETPKTENPVGTAEKGVETTAKSVDTKEPAKAADKSALTQISPGQSIPNRTDKFNTAFKKWADSLTDELHAHSVASLAYIANPTVNNRLRLRSLSGTQDKSAPQTTPATPTAPATDASPPSRALPSPIENPPFPFTDWTINSGFPIGESWDSAPGTLQHAIFGKKLDNTKFRIGGWMDAGIVVSNARDSNLPDTYNLIPKKPQLDQFVLVAQKMVDTTQKRYIDWGFYSAHLFGIDYRFTSATGYFSDQLTKHNNLYGYDPVLQWGEVYLPKVADGTVIQFGRFISPIDIEAQLSNSNYLYSHSLMFGVDPYTYTGINAQVRVNKEFMYQIGIHAGNENSPWSGRANVNGEFLVGWSSADNKDSLWGGVDSISGSGKTVKGHDDEQIINFVWGHVWNKRLHMQTQGYYMWQYDALVGGTPIIGPSKPYAGSGVGALIPGKAYAVGFVNNLEYKVNKNDYMSLRSGYLNDAQGWRTGVATHYSDFTLGYSHLFARNFWIRPEVRWDHSYDAASFDNGTKKDLFSVAGDIIMRF